MNITLRIGAFKYVFCMQVKISQPSLLERRSILLPFSNEPGPQTTAFRWSLINMILAVLAMATFLVLQFELTCYGSVRQQSSSMLSVCSAPCFAYEPGLEIACHNLTLLDGSPGCRKWQPKCPRDQEARALWRTLLAVWAEPSGAGSKDDTIRGGWSCMASSTTLKYCHWAVVTRPRWNGKWMEALVGRQGPLFRNPAFKPPTKRSNKFCSLSWV